MDGPLIELRAVERRFGTRRALAGLDLVMAGGEVLGLVGPNGSGKTTLMKLLAGFLRPSAGSVRVLGRDPFRERARVMQSARFAFAPPPLYDALSAREHLRMLASIRAPGAPRVGAAELDRALATVGLSSRADDRVRAFSFGMRQRLVLAQALVPMPRLLVLDEPTDGLDPLAILELREVLRRLRSEHGVGILLSSHLLVEVDRLVDRMVVLHEGRALFTGTPAELRAGGARLRLEATPADAAEAALRARGLAPERPGADGVLYLPAGALALEEAAEIVRAGGARLDAFAEERPTLERALLDRLREARS